eukprot:2338638-Pyramimonas_sp.AAC.3
MPAKTQNRVFQPAAALPAGAAAGIQRQSASLYTIQCHVEMLDTPTVQNAGMQLTFFDNKSFKDGTPSQRHGMSTLTNRTMSTLNLPDPPRAVERSDLQMRPPLAANNPTQGKSWAFVVAAVGTSATSAKSAVSHVAHLGEQLIRKAFFEANFTVPPMENKAQWTVRAEPLASRLALTREGTQNNGQPYVIRELLNFNISVCSNVPPAAAKIFQNVQLTYPTIISYAVSNPAVGLSATPPPAPSASSGGATAAMKRPAASSAGPPRKRPARNA